MSPSGSMVPKIQTIVLQWGHVRRRDEPGERGPRPAWRERDTVHKGLIGASLTLGALSQLTLGPKTFMHILLSTSMSTSAVRATSLFPMTLFVLSVLPQTREPSSGLGRLTARGRLLMI
jgi:hypothetical protein